MLTAQMVVLHGRMWKKARVSRLIYLWFMTSHNSTAPLLLGMENPHPFLCDGPWRPVVCPLVAQRFYSLTF